MSKIIKAADLKVLIPNDQQTVIPAANKGEAGKESTGGTILQGSNLMQDAQQQAAFLLEEAQKKAAELLAQADQKLEALCLRAEKEGFQKGYQEGLEAGKQEALAQARALLDVLQATVEEAITARANSLAASEDDFLKFSLILADKIVRKAVSDDLSWLAPIIKDALSALGLVSQITIRLNPIDYALVRAEEEELAMKTRAKLLFESDLSITQGGCVIESENGLIDARLEKRLEKICRHLTEVLYHEQA